MSNFETLARTPLPTEEMYFKAARDVAFQVTKDGNVSVNVALRHMVSAYMRPGNSHAKFNAAIGTFAGLVVPIDRSTQKPVEGSEPLLQIIKNGALAGAAINNILYGDSMPSGKLLFNLRVQAEDEVDGLQERHEFGADTVGLGHEGMRVAGQAAEEVLEALEDRVVPAQMITHANKFRVGTGLMILSGRRYHEAAIIKDEIARLETAGQSGDELAWEKAFFGTTDTDGDTGKSA